jgi:hypothetical protein
VQPPLERGEVDPSSIPADEFAVEHGVDAELGVGLGDLREVPGERSVLARLQSNGVQAPKADAAVS